MLILYMRVILDDIRRVFKVNVLAPFLAVWLVMGVKWWVMLAIMVLTFLIVEYLNGVRAMAVVMGVMYDKEDC